MAGSYSENIPPAGPTKIGGGLRIDVPNAAST